MAQDNTPAIVMYKGAQEDGYSIPFDKGFYGEVKVAFVRRGLTDYEYAPTTYTVDGALYAWEVSTGVYYYTKSATPAVDATVYNSGNQEISGVKVVSTQNASASFSDGNTGIRSNKKDIHSHALLFWTGEPLGDDDWICIVRETVKKQPYSYPNNQKHIEGALDNLSRQIQELKAQSDVSLKVDPTFVQDPQKMNPIDWLNTIVRSTDTTARGFRYRNFWLEYSTDDPNKAESDKSWTKLLNTTNITSVREWYDEDNKVYIPQYSMDGGVTWKQLGAIHLIEDLQEQIDEIKENVYTKAQVDGKLTAIDSQIDANADAIQKTREDFANSDQAIRDDMNAEDSRLQTQITAQAAAITTNKNDIDELGDDIAEIQAKIPESASGTNHLVTKQQLLDEEMDIREDMNQSDSELQSQITAQAAAIATLDSEKLDKNQGSINAGKILTVGEDGLVVPSAGGTGGGLQAVSHDNTLSGAGTDDSPLGLSEAIKDEIADKAPKETVEALTQIINGIIGDYVKKSGDTMTGALNVPEITVQTAEGTFTVSVVAGVVTIATNNGLDFASHVKFDHAPTTDDNTTWANALDTSLVRKAQVAAAISSFEALPDQTGNAGKFLKTDGSKASWEKVPQAGTKVIIRRGI